MGWHGVPGWHALVPTIGAALIIYTGTVTTKSRASFASLLSVRPIQWIGNISYSLYLWHWPLIVFAPLFFPSIFDGAKGTLLKLILMSVALIVAWLSYRFIEQPSQKIRVQKRWIYLGFLATTMAIALAAYGLLRHVESTITTTLNDMHSVVKTASPCVGAAFHSSCSQPSTASVAARDKVASFDSYNKLIRNGQTCYMYHAPPRKEASLDYVCHLGTITSPKKIVVWGDSHAVHLSNAFDAIGARLGIEFIVIASGECSGVQMESPACKARFDYIQSTHLLQTSDAVIVSNWVRALPQNGQSSTEKTVRYVLTQTDKPVYLLQDTPLPGEGNEPPCLMRRHSCENNHTDALSMAQRQVRRVISSGLLPDTHIIPTEDMFCDASNCHGISGGIPVYESVYWDDPTATVENGHLTASYSYSLAHPLEEKLRRYNIIP